MTSREKVRETRTLKAVQFYFFGGVQDVRVESRRIVGRWRTDITDLTSWPCPRPGEAVMEFVNTVPSAEGIAHFTRKFGPLRSSPPSLQNDPTDFVINEIGRA